jgi:hypothetical protein
LVLVPLLVIACTPPEKTRWTKPSSGASPRPADAAGCRVDANRRAEREYLLDTQSRSDDAFATDGSLRNELTRRDARRYRLRLYENCLRNLGYERAPVKGQKAR